MPEELTGRADTILPCDEREEDQEEYRQAGVPDLAIGGSVRVKPDDADGGQDSQSVDAGNAVRWQRNRCRDRLWLKESLTAWNLRDFSSHGDLLSGCVCDLVEEYTIEPA
jgi:hypothetical protein